MRLLATCLLALTATVSTVSKADSCVLRASPDHVEVNHPITLTLTVHGSGQTAFIEGTQVPAPGGSIVITPTHVGGGVSHAKVMTASGEVVCFADYEVTPVRVVVTAQKAVFAVRNVSCALCHAKIESNVISDFGIGSGEESETQALIQMFYSTQEGQPYISGDFLIPRSTIAARVSDVENGESKCGKEIYYSAGQAHTTVDLAKALRKCALPSMTWGPNSNKFVEKSVVKVTPPSSPDQVRAIVDRSLLAAQGYALTPGSSIAPLQGHVGQGFTIAGDVTCNGAVVFDTPVVIRDAHITTATSCRIYSSMSIFVSGELNVLGPQDRANIQLLSPVYVGLEISTSDTAGRLTHSANSFFKFSRGTGAEVNALIAADALLVAGNNFTSTGTASYKKIAISAPVVYSRTTGGFSGVIVAEQFIGKIDALSFTFDPVFSDSNLNPFFPEIKTTFADIRD